MRRVAVCVPVHNERASLPALVAALREQTARQDTDITLCCFFDGCGDDSEAIVRSAAGDLPLRIAVGPARPSCNAGKARAASVAIGLEALAGEAGALLCTDADTVPARDWAEQAIAALAHCDVVAGLIERDASTPEHPLTRLEAYYDRLYALRRAIDPVLWESGKPHHYTGGANLGMWAAAYQAVGGFRPLARGEDATLVDDAARAGLRVRRDRAMRVRTSSRLDGRAVGGLAAMLRAGADEHAIRVGDPRAAAWQYARHASARSTFPDLPDRARAGELGRFLGLEHEHVIGVARDCPNAEAFAMRVVPAAPGHGGDLPLTEAERALLALERAAAEAAA